MSELSIEEAALAELEQEEQAANQAGDQKKGKIDYEALNMVRYTLILGKSQKEKLSKLAKQFKITQSSVIEALVDNVDMQVMTSHFEAKERRRGGRTAQTATQRDLINMLKGMTKEQLEAAQEAVKGIKAP